MAYFQWGPYSLYSAILLLLRNIDSEDEALCPRLQDSKKICNDKTG